MQKTSNYQLSQYEPGDAIKRADFNQDNVQIDAALSNQQAAIDAKAEQSDFAAYKSANDAAVAKKAAQSALDATNQNLASTGAALAAKKIVTGSFTVSADTELNVALATWPATPKLVLLSGQTTNGTLAIPTSVVRMKDYTASVSGMVFTVNATNITAAYLNMSDDMVIRYAAFYD